MADKYDEAIAYLMERPEEIVDAWVNPDNHAAGCLFKFACSGEDTIGFGCLTQIRGRQSIAETKSLTSAIRDDDRILEDEEDITVDNLPVFAEWQRRLDKELGRPAP